MPSDMSRQSILRTIETMEECDNELEKQILALESQRKQLEQARSTIGSALIVQKAYLAPIRRLPLEVLLNVMACACEGEIDLAVRICPPLALGAVCKTWRDLMLASPRLWAKWSIERYYRTGMSSGIVARRLQAFVERSGGVPFTQTIEYRHHLYLCENDIDYHLISQTHRWQYLYLRDSPTSVDAVDDFVWIKDKPFPLLQKLRGTARHLKLAVESGVFEGFRSLRFVVISNEEYQNAIPALPWAQLEALHTRLCSNPYALQVLQQCRQLRRWTHTDLGIKPGLWAPPNLIRLKHLREITVYIPFSSEGNLLPNLITPALESMTIVWDASARDPFITRAIPALVARSSCTLRRLELYAPFFIDYDCLLALRDVRKFYLKGSDYAPVNQPFIDKLIMGDLFPLLETLGLSGNLTFSDNSVRELVRVRRSAGDTLQQIILDFTDHDIVRHGPYQDVVDGLREVPSVYVRP
ncbi:hypothetical protein K523DRAFT_259475 [Schizophyllum commune Tattone D]|nr:hypothetical protein K523DRAFT_259475 [Schizophyllum commune Tattone D]